MIAALSDRLQSAQNADGGWGAVRGRQSNTEITALATMALRHGGAAERAAAERGLAWLRQRQLADGSWPLTVGAMTSSWTTSLATLCVASEGDRDSALRGADWLLRHRGNGLGVVTGLLYRLMPERMPTRLNPDLRGWAWTANEFSWVEPTAYAVLALKKLRGTDSGRAATSITEAEQMLYDRACDGGGWNYGNSTAYGVALPAYLETTALALLALQDHPGDARNRQAFTTFRRMLDTASSGLALSWSILCLRAHRQDASPWIRRLEDAHARTAFLGETKPAALALMAATERGGVFQLS